MLPLATFFKLHILNPHYGGFRRILQSCHGTSQYPSNDLDCRVQVAKRRFPRYDALVSMFAFSAPEATPTIQFAFAQLHLKGASRKPRAIVFALDAANEPIGVFEQDFCGWDQDRQKALQGEA